MQFDAKHDFSVWLRTGSNPADIDRFRSHTREGILITLFMSEDNNLDLKINSELLYSVIREKFKFSLETSFAHMIVYIGGGRNFKSTNKKSFSIIASLTMFI